MTYTALINPSAPQGIIDGLIKNNIEPKPITPHPDLDINENSHPDLQFCIINNSVIYAPNSDLLIFKNISQDYQLMAGQRILQKKYPLNVAYNLGITPEYAWGKTETLDTKIIAELKRQKIKLIDTNQGYSRCLSLGLNNNSVITSDCGLGTTLRKAGLKVLVINQGHINLTGFRYGFIGGCCGIVDNMVVFSGNPQKHPEGELILDFIREAGMDWIILQDEKLLDLGSIPIIKNNSDETCKKLHNSKILFEK